MMRLLVPIGLTFAGLLASGCSGGYYVDAAQYRQARVATADDPTRRTRVVSSGVRTRTARTTITQNDGTVGEADQIRPWPRRGTPEWERTLAQEAQREKRVKDAINSICRGC